MTCKLTARQVKEMRSHRAEGVPLATLAAWYDVSPAAIQYHTKDIPPPPGGWVPGSPRKFDIHAAIRMKAEGHSRKVIAERFGCNPNYVTNAFLAHRRRQEHLARMEWKAAA